MAGKTGKPRHLYIGEGAGPNLVPFYADNKSRATTMAKEMGLKAFGKLTAITMLSTGKITDKTII